MPDIYPNLWDTIKAVPGGEFMALIVCIKNLEKPRASYLTAHLKAVEQKETNTSKRSATLEIIKLRTKFKKIETKS